MVSSICYVHPYLGKTSNLTSIWLIFFKMGWTTNQSLVIYLLHNMVIPPSIINMVVFVPLKLPHFVHWSNYWTQNWCMNSDIDHPPKKIASTHYFFVSLLEPHRPKWWSGLRLLCCRCGSAFAGWFERSGAQCGAQGIGWFTRVGKTADSSFDARHTVGSGVCYKGFAGMQGKWGDWCAIRFCSF